MEPTESKADNEGNGGTGGAVNPTQVQLNP